MSRRFLLALATALALPSTAFASRCDTWLKRADTATGEQLVAAYRSLASCDAELGRTELPRFMVKAGDVETLVPLTLAGIERDAWTAIWEVMEKVPYEARPLVAEGIGAACTEQPKVVTFLQGAHAGIKGTAFASWAPALTACPSDDLRAWIEGVVAAPPTGLYSQSYSVVVDALLALRGPEALPVLEQAAVKAGTGGGPFHNLLEAMQRAIEPKSFRDKVAPEHQAALEEALVRVAEAVPPAQARQVADRLQSAGAETRAAGLLPAIFPDRVTADGALRWAAAAIEQCDGAAVVHWVSWTEAPTRLDVLTPAAEPLRAQKAGLKCDAGEWALRVTAEPLAEGGAKAWAGELAAELQGQGLKVKLREAKKAVIPQG